MTSMKTMRFPRLRRLLSVLALLALPLAGCEDAGNTPSGPGADGPLVNEGKAGITASAENSPPGGSFTIIGYFNDGNGRPVEGTPILCASEGDVGFINSDGAFVPYFTFGTNPTLTAANGGFSVNVGINTFTPLGSYTLMVFTSPAFNGPFAVTYLHIMVESGGEFIQQPLPPEGPTTFFSTTDVTFYADGTLRTSQGDDVEYLFLWGDGTSTPADPSTGNWVGANRLYSATKNYGGAIGNFEIRVVARCRNHPNVISVVSDPLQVTTGLVVTP